jgi:hypothetical protein
MSLVDSYELAAKDHEKKIHENLLDMIRQGLDTVYIPVKNNDEIVKALAQQDLEYRCNKSLVYIAGMFKDRLAGPFGSRSFSIVPPHGKPGVAVYECYRV